MVRHRTHTRGGAAIIPAVTAHRQRGWRLLLKRTFDLGVAAALLLVTWPLMLLVAALVRIRIGAPVIFRQQRPGRDARPFMALKFRTMTNETDSEGVLLPDEKRLHRFGRFLRSTSLDELPQLINVLRGDMSLVGPRPLLMRYLERYSPEQARRHDVMPGITGWAQINGRNALSWEERFELDLWYVDHWSLALDFGILLRTIGVALRRRGVSSDKSATMPEFMGSEKR